MNKATRLTTLDEQAIEYIAIGAAVLGTGGGGDPHVGKLMAMEAIRTFGPFESPSSKSWTMKAYRAGIDDRSTDGDARENPSAEQLTKPLDLMERGSAVRWMPLCRSRSAAATRSFRHCGGGAEFRSSMPMRWGVRFPNRRW